MPVELKILAWGCVLAFVHIFAAAAAKTRQYGRRWNMGARDEKLPEPKPLVGRLMRAQANFFETFPIMAAALLMVAVSGRGSAATQAAAFVWLGARILYLPLYAAGVPVVRTLVFALSVAAIVVVLWPVLF